MAVGLAGWCHLSAAAALARPPDKRAANELLANDVELDVRSMRLRLYACVGSDPVQAWCLYAMGRARASREFCHRGDGGCFGLLFSGGLLH